MKLLKTSFATIVLMAILLFSGFSAPITSANSGEAQSTQFAPQAPTSTGSASAFLSGPTTVAVPFGSPGDPAPPSGSDLMPYHNPKPATNPQPNGDPPALSTTVPPTVNCRPDGGQTRDGSGCDTISPRSDGARTNPLGLNVLDSTPFAVQPPDQGLCAGNGYVMEVLNLGELQVYDSSLRPVSGVVTLESLMGLTAQGWSSGGDPMCVYDYDNGGHWIVTQIVSTNTFASGGPFTNCFVGGLNGCLEGIAVSVTNNPMGAYNVYFLNPNAVNSDPGVGQLLNDYAKIATTRDAFLIFYDEYNLGPLPPGPCPGTFGCAGFNGAQQFAFSKNAMELGLSVSDPSFNVAYENMGTASNLYPIPADGTFLPVATGCATGPLAGFVCWYQVIPAQTPDPSQYNNENGGTGYMVGSLDFLGAGDNRIAAFDWTGLSNLNSPSCGSCSGIAFGGSLLTGQVTYLDGGVACFPSQGSLCGLGAQKAGPVPLGDNCNTLNNDGAPPLVAPCPESGLATNGDGATEASYAQGQLWTAVATQINQTFSQHESDQKATFELHMGATYWVIGAGGHDPESSFEITNQGYISASHEDIEFSSIAAPDHGSAVVAFTLSGNGGPSGADNGGFYPSTAFGTLTPDSHGLAGGVIHIADLGQSPYDGSTEYIFSNIGPPFFRPRWGDYSQAIFVPGMGEGHDPEGSGHGGVFFATEYIQYPNCSDSAFLSDPTCGGTRAPHANWGSSINFLGLP